MGKHFQGGTTVLNTCKSGTAVRSVAFALVFLVASSSLGDVTDGTGDQAAKTVVMGTVVDFNGRPAAGASIGYLTAEELRADAERRVRSAAPGQGVYGRMSEEQKQEVIELMSRIRPPTDRTYADGKVVAQTDDSGAFRAELPGGGIYIITAKARLVSSSRQPVVIESGQVLELVPPIVLPPIPGPACCGAPLLRQLSDGNAATR